MRSVVRVFESVEESLRDGGEAGLGSDEGAGKDGTRLVLASAVDGVEHGGFEIVTKAGGEVVGGRELVVDGAGHAVNDGHFPRRLDADIRIHRRSGHVGRREQSVR